MSNQERYGANAARAESLPCWSSSCSASSTRMGTGRMRTGCGADVVTEAATSAQPPMLWRFSAKPFTSTSGSSMVQMPEVSLTPVRLSMRT